MAGGRPLGTFSDPACRVRAWHWLGATLALARASRIRELDQPDHPLSRGLARKSRFDQIRQDGYDPDRVTAYGNVSLMAHVARNPRFSTTFDIYTHMFWSHLEQWAPSWPGRENWLAKQLRNYGIVRYTPEDHLHGIELGLLAERCPWEFSSPAPLNLDPARFATLDGLLLLLVMLRESQDAAHMERASRLSYSLRRAAWKFAHKHQYLDEVFDTWQVMVGSRMAAWHPKIEPTEESLALAEKQLLEEKPRSISMCQRLATSRTVSRSRSERRWRRRVQMRACLLTLERVTSAPHFDYRDASLLFDWLIDHRSAIDRHRAWAIEWLILGEEEARPNDLSPLVMPRALYVDRRRPCMTDEEQNVFGNTSIYDVVPVVREDSSDE